MSTQDRTLVTLTLDGIDCGSWETITGRELTSEGEKYRPGPGQAQVAQGGPSAYSDIVVTRTYLEAQADLVRTLHSRGARAQGFCTESALDPDYVANGERTTWPVRLQGIKVPDVDIDSGNKQTLELTMWVSGNPS